MNEEMEMSLETGEEAPAAETPETAPEGGEISAQETRSSDAGQDPAEDTNDGEEGENTPEDDAGEIDEYDGFYHDLSDFEQEPEEGDESDDEEDSEEDAEGGDTPTDPEGEDGDEGENEGEAASDGDGTNAEGSEQEGQAETGEGTPEQDEPPETEPVSNSFASWEQEDRAAILAAHPELESVFAGKHLRDVLDDPALFGYMRGSAENRAKYSAVEAFEKASAKLLATRAAKAQAKQNSKQHIKSGGGKAATPPSSIPQAMMKQLREMFSGKTLAELEQLYKKVT